MKIELIPERNNKNEEIVMKEKLWGIVVQKKINKQRKF